MYSLTIDTSNAECSACISQDHKILDFQIDKEPNNQSKNLFLLIDHLFKKNQISYSSIKEIILTVGPGSFTGIRVALAAMRAIHQVSKIPLLGLSNLQIIAFDAALLHNLSNKEIYAIINARRGQLYVQKFSADLRKNSEPILISISEFFSGDLYQDCYLVSDLDTLEILPDKHKEFISPTNYQKIDAVNLVKCSAFYKKHQLFLPPSPLYVRPADVTAPKSL